VAICNKSIILTSEDWHICRTAAVAFGMMINFPDQDTQSLSEERIGSTDQIPRFANLRSAGRQLALQLETYRGADGVVILAPVLGGVPVAHEVANHLGKPLDFLIRRQLLLPQGPGSDINAVSVAGRTIIDERAPALPADPLTPLEHFLADAIAGLQSRERICRGTRPPLNLIDKIVILVDCGIHTGGNMRAAVTALRKTESKQIIAAVPVTSHGGRDIVAALADDFVSLASPKPFGHVGLWYDDFSRPGDDEICKLLRL